MAQDYSSIRIMRHFYLCQEIKSPLQARADWPEKDFVKVLQAQKKKIGRIKDGEIKEKLKSDSYRYEGYQAATWSLRKISLKYCSVFPNMGGREWAFGTIHDLLPRFRDPVFESPQSQIWALKKMAALWAAHLPIIVWQKGSSLRIDDGSHRAMAMALAGIDEVEAYVGVFMSQPTPPRVAPIAPPVAPAKAAVAVPPMPAPKKAAPVAPTAKKAKAKAAPRRPKKSSK